MGTVSILYVLSAVYFVATMVTCAVIILGVFCRWMDKDTIFADDVPIWSLFVLFGAALVLNGISDALAAAGTALRLQGWW